MYKHYLYFTLLFFYFSCSISNRAEEKQPLLLNIPDKQDKAYFMNHFELDNIVPIETTDSFLVSDVKKVIKEKDEVILLSSDNKSVFIIDSKTGGVLTHIHKPGTGLGESNIILDIAFDDLSEHVLIYNDYNKLLVFNKQGEFLYEERIEGMYNTITCHQGEVFFYNKLDGYSCYPYLIKVYDLKNKTWEEIGNDTKIEFPIRSKGMQMVKSKQIWLTALLDFKIYLLENMKIEPLWQLDITTSYLNKSLIEKSVSNPLAFFSKVKEHRIIYNVNSVRETDKHLCFYTNHSDLFFINKNDNETVLSGFTNGGPNPDNYYPHEGDDNSIMFIISADEWLSRYASTIEMSDRLREKMELLNMYEDDNPILLFYKEK